MGSRIHLDEIGPFNLVNIGGTALVFLVFLLPLSVNFSNMLYILWAVFGYFCLNTAY
jgi:hypothetical protein